jgi:hypothetical protein
MIERLERRTLPSADVLSYHNDLASTGQNTAETVLTRSNVNQNTFGKLFSFPVQGQIFAQPLIQRNINIPSGTFAGIHDVVFVATEHDQLYAFDAGTLNGADSPSTLGQLLWQRNFLDLANPNNHLASATALAAVPQGDVLTADIIPEIGITSTPVIDPATNTIYVITKTRETVAGVAHYVQRLHAINTQDGSDRAVKTIGDTTGTSTYFNNTQIYSYGSGDGFVTDPYNGTGQRVVQFNALREHSQAALSLVNGVVYAGFGSHGDNGPFHGWMIGWDKNTLAVKGVLNTSPNGSRAGFWMSGGTFSFDGTYFYTETGDGTFDANNGASTASAPTSPAPGPVSGLNAQGFPVNGDYGNSFVKIALDSTTTPNSQNINGWGLKVVDYFTAFNVHYNDNRAIEQGSGAPLILPDSVGSLAHTHLLVGSGMDGDIYLIDRDDMGKFGVRNNVVQELQNQLSGLLGTPAYFNGRLYFVPGFAGVAKAFPIAGAHIATSPESSSTDSFAFPGSTPSISSNGLADGIVWDVDRGTNQFRAYSSDSYATELFTSAQAPFNRDALGAVVKWEVPTVANGHVYVGAGIGDPNNVLVVYGLLPPPTAVPNAPTKLLGQPASTMQINLGWTNNAVAPNLADSFYIEQSPNGVSGWQQIAITATPNVSVSGLAANTTYYFRVRAHDSLGFSDYAWTAAATSSGSHNIDFSAGFPSAANFTLNGGAAVSANRLNLSTAVANQARSVFFNTPQNISAFTTTFTYTKNGLADGATFVIQRDPRGLTALGASAGGLGYGTTTPIAPSFAFAINIYSGNSLGTEFLTNGVIDFHYSQSAINTSLNNTPITVALTYNGSLLTAQLTQGAATETKTILIDLPALLGDPLAFIGFTGGTGSSTATQDITAWTFDCGTPAAIPSQPDLLASSDSGVSNSDDITNDNTPTFSGIAAPGSIVTMRVFNQPLTSAPASPSGIYTITTGQIVNGNALSFTAISTGATASAPSQPLAVIVDTIAPTQAAPALFQFLHFPQSISFNFAEPVTGLVNALALSNLTDNFQIPPAKMAATFNSPTASPTWTFPGYPNGVLPDGNYHASLAAGSVTDIAGNPSAAEFSFDFFVLLGDLNRDRQVTISDFIDVSSNFNKTSASFTDGDMNYDGLVTISDFIDLAANFNKSIPILAPAPPQPAASLTVSTTKSKLTRAHHRRRVPGLRPSLPSSRH